jgi:hypothetical protein
MGRSDGSFHVAGLSNTASPSDNPEANVRKNEESGQPIKRFVIISNSTIGFGFRLLRRFWGGILGGLLFVAAIFWIDYRDRHPKRGRHHKAENETTLLSLEQLQSAFAAGRSQQEFEGHVKAARLRIEEIHIALDIRHPSNPD